MGWKSHFRKLFPSTFSFSGDKCHGSNLSKARFLVLLRVGWWGLLDGAVPQQTDGMWRENLCLNSAGMWIKPLN